MTDKIEPYTPITCGLHSEYELAIMRRASLRIGWLDDSGQQRIGTLLPIDLQTREHVEYLVARDVNNALHHIRLDRILRSNVREANRAGNKQ